MVPLRSGAASALLANLVALLLLDFADAASCAACGVGHEALIEGDHVSLLQVAPSWRKRSSSRRHEGARPVPGGWRDKELVAVDNGRQPFSGGGEHPLLRAVCGWGPQKGLLEVHRDDSNDMLLLEFTSALSRRRNLRVLVTAMTVAGTYMDDSGFVTTLASPMEETMSTVFDFRLSHDGTTLDVFQPEMGLRTSDLQSREALKSGAGSGWIASLDVLEMPPCPASSGEGLPAPGDRVVVDADELVWRGFFVAPMLASEAEGKRLIRARAYPQNVDITVEYMMSDPSAPVKVGFSMAELPEAPMTPRVSDDRLLYFTTEYKDLGSHDLTPERLPSKSVDGKVEVIWRYDLASLPGGQIRIHVDPTVPERWRKPFAEGVEAWNDAFELAGHPKAVRAVLPEDPDWPSDYDLGDARYSTISWSLTPSVVSMGIAKVDPRSGQIMKSDILMSDGWVRAWLSDLDHLAPNLTHWVEQSRGSTSIRKQAQSQGSSHSAPHGASHGSSAEEVSLEQRGAISSARSVVSLLSAGVGKPLSEEQLEDVLAEGLRQIVMHETGHILGLRHNFKGSLGVSYACTRDKSCSAVHGLSASVMDYLPMNLPSESEKEVHYFSPVVGAYDKLAIRYGYTVTGKSEDLDEILLAAESYEVCYDDDQYAEDPTCIPYDFTGDPLQYYDDQLARIADAHRYLLNGSIVPGATYVDYGDAVDELLWMTEAAGADLVNWLGGVANAYAHRGLDGSAPRRVPRKSVPASSQRRALALLLRVLRPDKFGLLPPLESLPFLVSSEGVTSGHVSSLHLSQRVRGTAVLLLRQALGAGRLLQVLEQEQLADVEQARHNGSKSESFGVGELLAELVGAVLSDGLGAAQEASPAWDMQLHLVKSLRLLHEDKTLPAEISSHVLYHLEQIREAILVEFRRADQKAGGSGWKACGKEGQECKCSGLVRYGSSTAWSAALRVAGSTHCGNAVFGDPTPKTRKRCECLSTRPLDGDLLRSHLLLLRRELSGIFCSGDGGASNADCVDELRAVDITATPEPETSYW